MGRKTSQRRCRRTTSTAKTASPRSCWGRRSDALARGAAPALETLWLWSNEIGDEGVRHLGDALTRGAAPALEELYLRGNPASDAAKQALLDARPGLRIFY